MIHTKDEYQRPPDEKTSRVAFHEKLKELARRGVLVPDVVPYPGNDLRVVVRNQFVLRLDGALNTKARSIRLIATDVNGEKEAAGLPVKILRQSHCNPNLVLLEGEGIHLLVGPIEVVYSPDTITPPPKVRDSSANDVHYSPDTITPPPKVRDSAGGGSGTPTAVTPASFDAQLRRIERDSPQWATFPVVAVMDTGIDFAYPNTERIPVLYNGGKPVCHTVEPDYIGWDFVHDQNNPYDDDDDNKHGSRIAAIISRELDHCVRILPLKVIDRLGIGLLFDIYCAFEYMLSGNITRPVAINASWGFYSRTQDALLTGYMEELKKAGIWLINAAGNEGDIEENETQDLGAEPRWPACYSEEHPHVITVTTVRQHGRHPAAYQVVENYSRNFVNIGIGSGTNSKFAEPLVTDANLPQVKGSSYATPYAVAFVTKSGQSPTTPVARLNLLQALPGRLTALSNEINQGVVVPVETT